MSRVAFLVVGVVCLLAGVAAVGVVDANRVTVTCVADPTEASDVDVDDAVVSLPDATDPARRTGTAAIDGSTTYEGLAVRIGSTDASLFLVGSAGRRIDAPLADARYARTTDRT